VFTRRYLKLARCVSTPTKRSASNVPVTIEKRSETDRRYESQIDFAIGTVTRYQYEKYAAIVVCKGVGLLQESTMSFLSGAVSCWLGAVRIPQLHHGFWTSAFLASASDE
jgi:hypothetical protein